MVFIAFKIAGSRASRRPHVLYPFDADSGVDTQFFTGKVNQDNKPDIVIGNKHGVFVFTQK